VAGPRAANAIPEPQILDAAYDVLLAIGMRRMTMTDIARKSGVSRATLYRRWPNVAAVVGSLVTRELAAVAAAAFPSGAAASRAGLVTGIVAIVRAVRDHPLLRKIVEVDREFLLPYLLQRRGTSTEQQLGLLEAALRGGDASMRSGDPALLARTMWLVAASFVLTGPVLADGAGAGGVGDGTSRAAAGAAAGGSGLEALDGELAELLDRYLRP
jgi:AcrR family transcriptional regulator